MTVRVWVLILLAVSLLAVACGIDDEPPAEAPEGLGCTEGFIVGLAGRPVDPGFVAGEPLPEGLIEAVWDVRLSVEDFETVEVTGFAVTLRSTNGLASRPETGETFVEVALVRDEEAVAEGLPLEADRVEPREVAVGLQREVCIS